MAVSSWGAEHEVDLPPRSGLDEPLVAALPGIDTSRRPGVPPNDRSYRFRFLVSDVLALAVAGALFAGGGQAARLVVVAPAFVLLAYRASALYAFQVQPSVLEQASRIAYATFAAVFVANWVVHVTPSEAGRYAVAVVASVVAMRAGAYTYERRRAVTRPRQVVLVGASASAQAFADRLLRHPEYGMVPIGFVDELPAPIDPDLALPVLGGLDQLSHVLREFRVDRIVLDGESTEEDAVRPLLHAAVRAGVEVAVLPRLAQHLSTAILPEGVAGMTLLAYRSSRHAGVGWLTKRVLDVVLAALAIVVTAPAWVAAIIAIKIDSPGPLLFTQERVGRGGRRFRVLKFRSMVHDAEARLIDLTVHNEAEAPYFKVASDPRVTRVGRWLRRSSIDELPQLVNVLRGEMSLVGPRPALPREVEQFPQWFRRRLDVPPGVSGLWQVSGRFLLPFDEATRLDVFYVDHWSLGLDLKILARTPGAVLLGRGAR